MYTLAESGQNINVPSIPRIYSIVFRDVERNIIPFER